MQQYQLVNKMFTLARYAYILSKEEYNEPSN